MKTMAYLLLYLVFWTRRTSTPTPLNGPPTGMGVSSGSLQMLYFIQHAWWMVSITILLYPGDLQALEAMATGQS